jgi:hypothetical protein
MTGILCGISWWWVAEELVVMNLSLWKYFSATDKYALYCTPFNSRYLFTS